MEDNPSETPSGTPSGTSSGTPSGTSSGTPSCTPSGTSSGTPSGTSSGTPSATSSFGETDFIVGGLLITIFSIGRFSGIPLYSKSIYKISLFG